MDAAFNRRISYRIFFSATDEKTRLSIWKRIFPVEVNTEKVRFEELAEELELSGAEIKNLALRAAYAAAGEPISMKHIRSVLKNELERSGIFINESDLVHWYRDE